MAPMRIQGFTSHIDRSRSKEEEATYQQVRTYKLMDFRSLFSSQIFFPVSWSFQFLHFVSSRYLQLLLPFDLVFEFFANLLITSNHSYLQSFIHSWEVSLSPKDYYSLLILFISDPSTHVLLADPTFSWAPMNFVLYGIALSYQEPLLVHWSLMLMLSSTTLEPIM